MKRIVTGVIALAALGVAASQLVPYIGTDATDTADTATRQPAVPEERIATVAPGAQTPAPTAAAPAAASRAVPGASREPRVGNALAVEFLRASYQTALRSDPEAAAAIREELDRVEALAHPAAGSDRHRADDHGGYDRTGTGARPATAYVADANTAGSSYNASPPSAGSPGADYVDVRDYNNSPNTPETGTEAADTTSGSDDDSDFSTDTEDDSKPQWDPDTEYPWCGNRPPPEPETFRCPCKSDGLSNGWWTGYPRQFLVERGCWPPEAN